MSQSKELYPDCYRFLSSLTIGERVEYTFLNELGVKDFLTDYRKFYKLLVKESKTMPQEDDLAHFIGLYRAFLVTQDGRFLTCLPKKPPRSPAEVAQRKHLRDHPAN